jgi:hypothetical protein
MLPLGLLLASGFFVVSVLGLSGTAAAAQSLDSRPSAGAARIETSMAPVIDADLSDPAWARATIIDDFRQVEPVPGAAATERTVLRVMYDADNFYFGVYSYDTNPEQIAVRAMARDGALDTGDSIAIVLDPGLTRRNAYSFAVGPSGGRTDTLYLNNSDNLDEWDAIWTARARRVADGWIAEIAIPFRSLSYSNTQADWGFEFRRNIRHKNEELRWSSVDPALDDSDVSQAGTLTGIANIDQGVGLDVQIYGALRAKHDWHLPDNGAGLSFTGGGNAFYKITPALTGTLTVNPDFSDAPLDVRQVNTTRFSLFFPESRDFFLQDAGAFEFGGINFTRDGPDRVINNARPFFSRNLGLVKGVPVSILGGGKLSGEYGGTNIGALSVLTDRTPSAPGQMLSVMRVTRPLFGESRAGFVITHGDPTGATDNTVAGGDFQYRDARFLGGSNLVADAFYERSFSSAAGQDDSFGAAIELPNEPWSGALAFKEIGAAFTPALGFANRTGIRQYDASAGYTLRFGGAWLRTLEFDLDTLSITDLNDRLETRETQASVQFENNPGDQFQLEATNFFENVPEAFDLPRDIIVPAGKYDWTNISVSFESSNARTLAIDAQVTCCSFYNGRSIEASIELSYRPNEYFEIVPSYEASFIDMPAGRVDIHVLAAESVVNFTPDMQLAIQAQFDNISESFSFLARYRWEYQPGSELFAAFGQSAIIPGTNFEAQTSQVSLRLGHTFRF